jgi:quercetin dioxygenase-like cupin family protein
MKIIKQAEVQTLSEVTPDEGAWLRAEWIEGPFNSNRLDVGMVTMNPGGATPAHVHLGGQVLVVTSGEGFIETGGERHIITTGDVVVCPPGEEHVHGASDHHHLSHLTITTGPYTFPNSPTEA